MSARSLSARRTQQGAVAVAFILLSTVLLGFVALAMDIARLYVSKAELQNAADACALAASAALTGANANQLEVAENYGITAGLRNRIGMQAVSPGIAPDADITFSDTLNGSFQSRSAAAGNELAMHYAKCTLTEAEIPTLMIHVINLLPGQQVSPSTVQASAVAGLEPSKSNCALPVAICEEELATKEVGDWISGVFKASSQSDVGGSLEGAFKWIKFSSKENLKDLEAYITGDGFCDLSDPETVELQAPSKQGQNFSLMRAWNTRFGIYKNNEDPADALPDFTGWVYDPTLFPQQKNAYPDFLNKRAQATPKHQDQATYPVTGGEGWAADSYFQNGKDRRMVVGPIVKCADLAGNGKPQIKAWACYLMLNPVLSNGNADYPMYFEYRGLAKEIASGCVTSGAPGGPGAGGPNVPALVQ